MTERKASMGDKVYRGDVIKFIRNNISLGTFMKRTVKTADEACWDLCDKLNYVPAIEEKPEPHWIPVTERYPEENDYRPCYGYEDGAVWWRNDTGLMGLGWYYPSTDKWAYYDELDRCEKCVGNVVEWMPLPEPYKEVTE